VSLTVLEETSDIQSLRERPKIGKLHIFVSKIESGIKKQWDGILPISDVCRTKPLDIHIKACLSGANPSFASRDHIHANLF
jgi:hypothetical protein